MKLVTSLMLGLLMSVAALAPNQATAQSPPQPAVVVSIASLDEQMNDIKYLLTASGFPEFNFFAKAAIKPFTEGIDSTSGSGVLIFFRDDETPYAFSGFVPIEDMDDLLDVIAGNMGEVEDADDDSFTIFTNAGTEISVKEKDGYAIFASEPALLASVPDDPATLLGDLPAKYNLAAKLMPQQLPESIREKAIDLIRQGASQTLDELDEELSQEQQKNMQKQLQQFESLMNDTETVTIGMSADENDQKLFTEIEFIAKDGSELAANIQKSKPTEPSRFSGFLIQGAAMNGHFQGKIAEEDTKQYWELLADGKQSLLEELNEEGDFNDAEYGKIESAVTDILSVVQETIEAGVLDGGMVLLTEEKDVNLAAGFAVANPAKLEATAKDLAPIIKQKLQDEEDIEVLFNFDVATHSGVKFHEIKIPLSDGNEEVRDVFGDAVTVVLGLGADSVYVGAGTEPMSLVKKAMDSATETEHAMEINLFFTTILKFASRMQNVPPMVNSIADVMAENGRDRVRVYGDTIKNGTFSRIEMEDGILSLIKAANQAARGEFDNDF